MSKLIDLTGKATRCGCVVSKNESIIAQMLRNLNFSFIEQYTFPDLTSTGCECLPFDFAIVNSESNELLYLIEYDG